MRAVDPNKGIARMSASLPQRSVAKPALFGLFLVLVLSACATQERDRQATSEVRIAATPKAIPQRTVTNFSEALRCMDDLFVRYAISGVALGAQDIPDQTDVVSAGTKDMLITALSNMSVKSRAIRFVALGYDLEDISRFHTLHVSKNFKAPDFFIRGAITQVDRGVIQTQQSGGLSVGTFLSIEASKDRIASIVSLDMNMGLVSNLQILPGITSSNSIAVVQKGKGLDLSGAIEKLGALFRIDFTESEGLHHAVRSLIDLGSIELMGRLTQVPYWECLDIETTNPFVQKEVRTWFNALPRDQLLRFTQAKLRAVGAYDGPVDGRESQGLRSAIALYKSDHALIANGDVDFALYYQLLADPTAIDDQHIPLVAQVIAGEGTSVGRDDTSVTEEKVLKKARLETSSVTPLELELTTERGTRPRYRVGESVVLQVKASVAAHVYCYYQPRAQEVIKIFPNRYARESRVRAGTTTTIPGTDGFQIKFDTPGVAERVLCMAAYRDIERRLPSELRDNDLTPLSLASLSRTYQRPVRSVDDIYKLYKDAAKIVPLKKSMRINIL